MKGLHGFHSILCFNFHQIECWFIERGYLCTIKFLKTNYFIKISEINNKLQYFYLFILFNNNYYVI